MKCSSCGVGMVTTSLELVVEARGYKWHWPCANVYTGDDNRAYVDFPSDGKFIPDTVMTEQVKQ